MRESVEEALIIYRAEVDSFLTIITPAAALGLVLLIVADTSLTAALVAIPLLLIAFLLTYAACVQWAGNMVTSGSRTISQAWLDTLADAPQAFLGAAPAAVPVALIAGCAAYVSNEGFWYLGAGLGLLTIGAFARWACDHPYDLPLIVVYDAPAKDALESGPRLAAEHRDVTLSLLVTVFAPLMLGGVLCAALAWLMAPLAGAAIMLLLISVWMPFGALCLTDACLRLVDLSESRRRQFAEATL